MAVDTRDRRFSMMGLASGGAFAHVFPDPDGTINDNDRAQFLFLYHGINLAGQPAVGGTFTFGVIGSLERRRRRRRSK